MRPPAPLAFLNPGWFTIPMGVTGLGLAWHQAIPLLGEGATAVALVLGGLGLGLTLLLVGLMALRWHRHPQAWLDDLKHPVRHAFVATLPVALLLLAALGSLLEWPRTWVTGLWWPGAVLQLWATVWVTGRWLRLPTQQITGAPSPWVYITPVLLVAVVGNVVSALAGWGLGYRAWSVAQSAVGVALWPLCMALLLARRFAHGPLPDRLWPTWFITVAPPAVLGLAALRVGLDTQVGLAFWGVALFMVLWAGQHLRQVVEQPFGVVFWALSFPLAAFSGLTLQLAGQVHTAFLPVLGLLALAATSLTVLGLALATWRGWRNGTLLAPEPVASITPAPPQ
ncbi:MAG: hypothetical protein RJA09_2764 [Pseudomonadota bacterium]